MSEEHRRKCPPAGRQGGQNNIKYLNKNENPLWRKCQYSKCD